MSKSFTNGQASTRCSGRDNSDGLVKTKASQPYRYRGRKGRRSTSDTDADSHPDPEGHRCWDFIKRNFSEPQDALVLESCAYYSKPSSLSQLCATSDSGRCSTSTALFILCISSVPRLSARGFRIVAISGCLSMTPFRITGAGL